MTRKWWILLMIAGLVALGSGTYYWYQKIRQNPCTTKPVEELVNRYPRLGELREKHQAETTRLLAMHRQQDVMVNLHMSTDQLSPEEALRLSLGQIDQLAVLRKRHRDEFEKMCEAEAGR